MAVGEARCRVIHDPDEATVSLVSSLNPESPFCRSAYAAAMRDIGQEAYAILVEDGAKTLAGCMAFVRGNPGLRRMVIPTSPHIADPERLWSVLDEYFVSHGVSDIHFETYASADPTLPIAKSGTIVENRLEYRLSLGHEELQSSLSTNHRRNLRRARALGFEASKTDDLTAVQTHCRLVVESLERRKNKDERVDVVVNQRVIESLVKTGCAEIWQAAVGSMCHSSVVLLRCANSAYYYSAGTTQEGLTSGSSTALICSIARSLQDEGCLSFNLGGAGVAATGLRRFKKGFGAEEIPLARAHVKLISNPVRFVRKLRRKLLRAASNR